MNVPFLDLRAQHAPLKDEILETWADILDTCGFVGGPYHAAFEADFAAACGAANCITCSTGTDALILALRGLDCGPGDEVIVPANTFIATAEAVSAVGATPVFVDALDGTWNIDPDAAAAAVNSATVGIIGVHLYGQPFDVDAVQAVCDRHGLWLMEDSAQAHLATYKGKTTGSLAGSACFSFYPGKNLGAPGEGGAYLTNDDALFKKVSMIRDHGQPKKYMHQYAGYNMRMPAPMASALGIKLKHLADWTASRQRNAAAYIERLSGIDGIRVPEEPEWASSVYHLFVLHLADRDRILEALKEHEVFCGLHYPVPCPHQPCYTDLGYQRGQFPVAEYNASNCLSLPMFAELTEAQVDHVCTSLQAVL